MVEMRHLQSFLAVASTGGFRRATHLLHLSQPAVSKHVCDLERAVGVPLVSRGPGPVTLTEEGRWFAERAQRLVDDFAHAVEGIAAASLSADLVLLCTPGGAGELTAPLLRHLGAVYPSVRLRVGSFRLADWPVTPPAGVDLMIVRDPIADEDLRVTVLLEEAMHAAVPAVGPLAGARPSTLDDLGGLPFVRMSDGVSVRFTRFWSLQSTLGTTERQLVGPGVDGPGAMAAAVARGDGVAMATPMLSRIFAGRMPLVAVPGAPRTRIALVSRCTDSRPVVVALHREAERFTRAFGPLVLPELARWSPGRPQDVEVDEGGGEACIVAPG